jgi:multidrug efflux pump subunit AcrA (membrane-fusion protein)
MYASVTLRTEEADGVLAVPLQAVSQGEKPTVLVVGADNALAERPVVLGMRTSSLVEIRSGLSEGELVVVGDRPGLASGTVVSPKLVDTPTTP